MNPRLRAAIRLLLLLSLGAGLFLLFPRAYVVVQMAARDLRYFWWLILLVGLAIWFIWGVGRKSRR